jgi:hypothetical protein
MKAWLHTYFGRSILLGFLGILLIGTVWNKRLSGTVQRWRTNEQLSAGVEAGAPDAERLALVRAELSVIERELGDLSSSPDGVWQRVLTHIGEASAQGQVQLHRLEGELIDASPDHALHVLPITVAGTYPALLRLANELQRDVPEAHAVSIRFHTERATYGKPSTLLMTVYLQKIVRHA